MKEDRVASISGLDKVYQRRVDDKVERIDKEKIRLERCRKPKNIRAGSS